MKSLENRIPPPLVMLITLALMKLISLNSTGHWQAPDLRIVGALVALLGVAVAISGVLGFRKAQTTVNPLKPSKASSLVTSGIYTISRNPMYLGMLLVCLGWGLALASYYSFVAAVLFAIFITRFQIVPEERAMRELFGVEYTEFCLRTSRWL